MTDNQITNSSSYRCLQQQVFMDSQYKIIPLRKSDKYEIMKWRNEQLFHLRQNRPLTKEDQDIYFLNIVNALFHQERPEQILFSFLKDKACVGYGGLVHINWIDRNAEISFIMDTKHEQENFREYWKIYLLLIQQVAFGDLKLHKIYTYAFDVRPLLYLILESAGFYKEAVLKEHCYHNNRFIDVIIHSKYEK